MYVEHNSDPGSSVDTTSDSSAPSVDQALIELLEVLDNTAAEQRLLIERVQALQAARKEGRGWSEALAGEETPGTVQLISSMLAGLSVASGRLRRDLVVALREEGATIPAIARRFGVTHQRVSSLLRQAGH